MRRTEIYTFVTALLLAITPAMRAQDLASIREKLTAEYPLTQVTAAKDDIVKAGTVVVLKKSNLVTVDATKHNVCQNTYKNGRIKQNILCVQFPGRAGTIEGERTFVSGEKLWVTSVDVSDKGVVFGLFSDAFNDTRYAAPLTFPFAKGSTPSVADVDKEVGEVFTIQQSDDSKDAKQDDKGAEQQSPAPAQKAVVSQPATPPPAPIAPPPPPPEDPKTISLGQKVDDVTAALGQPQKVVKLAGTKQIYFYKDMKITFVGGKVTNVE